MFEILLNTLNAVKTGGVSVAILVMLSLIIYLIWKLATNHLHHIDMKLDTIIVTANKNHLILQDEIKSMQLNCVKHGERIAKVEGILE